MLLLPLQLSQLNPQVRNAGIEGPTHWEGRFRRIYDHEFIFCEKGKGTVIIGKNTYDLIPGSLVLIRPNIPHKIKVNSVGGIYWIHFDHIYRHDLKELHGFVKEYPSKLFDDKLSEQHYIRQKTLLHQGYVISEYNDITDIPYVATCFKRIRLTFHSQDPLASLSCKIYLLELFKYLLENHAVKGHEKDRVDALYPFLLSYIEEHYRETLKLSSLATLTGYSKDYISKVFKEKSGKNLTDYIHHVRLTHSIQLLEDTTLTAADISRMVGYSDPYYFNKSMKKYMGITPGGIRKKG